MKKTLIFRLILFVLTLGSFLGSAVFAWSTYVQRTQPIMFYSGRLVVDAKLFILDDPNYDGIVEVNTYTKITESHEFGKLIPGQIYTFKLEVTNLGNIPGNLKVEMFLDNLTDIRLYEVISLSYTNPISNVLIEKDLESNNLFFENKHLSQGVANKEAYFFQLYIKPELSNNLKSAKLIIEKFVITLDQIRP